MAAPDRQGSTYMVEAVEARRHRWLGEAVELAAVSSDACHSAHGEQVPRRRHRKEAVGDGGDLVSNYYSTLQ